MRGYGWWLIIVLVLLFTVAVRREAHPADLIQPVKIQIAECSFKFCQGGKKQGGIKRYKIRSNWENGRRVIGDVYDPGHGRRLQIRNNHRQILGYIERDGGITNTHRQLLGEVE